MLSITEHEFKALAQYIKQQYGIHLKDEKRSLLLGRLQQLLAQKQFDSFTDFYQYIASDQTGEAAVDLADKITTNHTFFMRETEHFTFFQDRVLPGIVANAKDKDVRVWSAGCSTGQEPYTLAMIINDFFGAEKAGWDTRILATDISSRVIAEAVQGEYTNEQIASLPAKWKAEYIRRKSEHTSVMSDQMKSQVIFRKFNLMDTVFPFKKKFHAIFCRNVMIYFDNPTKEELVNKFWDHLAYGGYLFIGQSESLNRERTKFRYIMPAVYRKE